MCATHGLVYLVFAHNRDLTGWFLPQAGVSKHEDTVVTKLSTLPPDPTRRPPSQSMTLSRARTVLIRRYILPRVGVLLGRIRLLHIQLGSVRQPSFNPCEPPPFARFAKRIRSSSATRCHPRRRSSGKRACV